MSTHEIIKIAVPAPLHTSFDYLPSSEQACIRGARVMVPFGNRKIYGVVLEERHQAQSAHKLKTISDVLDTYALIPENILALCQFASQYYHHPIGEVLFHALPNRLRHGKAANYSTKPMYRLTELGKNLSETDLKKTPAQARAIAFFKDKPNANRDDVQEASISQAILATLTERGFIERTESNWQPSCHHELTHTTPTLNPAQQNAVDTISTHLTHYQAFLLFGVTGSGKTEVYLRIMDEVLKQDKQVLFLVPEIGLTPQTVSRLTKRFAKPYVVLHSNLNDETRLNAWLAARDGKANIIIGTRSAIFTPLPKLGLIVIDEEHDSSYKQIEGLRYHARDLALWRAKQREVPIILGSATPDIITLHHVTKDRMLRLDLPNRAGAAKPVVHQTVDLRGVKLVEGLAPQLIDAIHHTLSLEQQVLLFINRRGYAPVYMCHSCGWIASCKACDSHLTLHRSTQKLHCHHCGRFDKICTVCTSCGSNQLLSIGLATERLEESLKKIFIHSNVIRIDRDSTQKRGALDNLLKPVHAGEPCIMIGTQMLAKGHHFPQVTLVGILDADQGLFSSDFRSSERLGQLIMQVSGRAGRAENPGTVYIQTHHPDHPLLQTLLTSGYEAFANLIAHEREMMLLPPYQYCALWHARARESHVAQNALKHLKRTLEQHTDVQAQYQLLGPIPALLRKRANLYRYQMLIKSNNRRLLHHLLTIMREATMTFKQKGQVKWALDVDPIEMA